MGIGSSIYDAITTVKKKKNEYDLNRNYGGYGANINRTNKFADQLEDAYNQINNREKFSYDMNNDAFYQQYASSYANNAKLAMENTVAQASALTGGYANSYAATAGQAMYNQQMEGLNDRATELYQLALQQYNAESDRLNNLYATTANAYGIEQDRINTEIAEAQWNAEYDEMQRQYNLGLMMDAAGMAIDVGKFGANMAFDVSRAAVSDSQWRESMDYQKERDAVADSQWQQSFDYKAGRDAVSDSQFAQELAYKYAALYNKSSGGDDGGVGDVEGDSDAYTYEGVVSFLNDVYGVDASGIMTESEFKSRKRRGAMSEYDSYASYAEAMINKYKNK